MNRFAEISINFNFAIKNVPKNNREVLPYDYGGVNTFKVIYEDFNFVFVKGDRLG